MGRSGWADGVGAEPIGSGVRVTFLDPDVGDGDAQLFGDDLGIGRLMTLPLGLGPEAGDHLAGRMDAYLGRVEHLQAQNVEVLRRTSPDNFGEAGDADPHQLTAPASLHLLPSEPGVTDVVHGLM